jgi:hypothetical protein
MFKILISPIRNEQCLFSRTEFISFVLWNETEDTLWYATITAEENVFESRKYVRRSSASWSSGIPMSRRNL